MKSAKMLTTLPRRLVSTESEPSSRSTIFAKKCYAWSPKKAHKTHPNIQRYLLSVEARSRGLDASSLGGINPVFDRKWPTNIFMDSVIKKLDTMQAEALTDFLRDKPADTNGSPRVDHIALFIKKLEEDGVILPKDLLKTSTAKMIAAIEGLPTASREIFSIKGKITKKAWKKYHTEGRKSLSVPTKNSAIRMKIVNQAVEKLEASRIACIVALLDNNPLDVEVSLERYYAEAKSLAVFLPEETGYIVDIFAPWLIEQASRRGMELKGESSPLIKDAGNFSPIKRAIDSSEFPSTKPFLPYRLRRMFKLTGKGRDHFLSTTLDYKASKSTIKAAEKLIYARHLPRALDSESWEAPEDSYQFKRHAHSWKPVKSVTIGHYVEDLVGRARGEQSDSIKPKLDTIKRKINPKKSDTSKANSIILKKAILEAIDGFKSAILEEKLTSPRDKDLRELKAYGQCKEFFRLYNKDFDGVKNAPIQKLDMLQIDAMFQADFDLNFTRKEALLEQKVKEINDVEDAIVANDMSAEELSSILDADSQEKLDALMDFYSSSELMERKQKLVFSSGVLKKIETAYDLKQKIRDTDDTDEKAIHTKSYKKLLKSLPDEAFTDPTKEELKDKGILEANIALQEKEFNDAFTLLSEHLAMEKQDLVSDAKIKYEEEKVLRDEMHKAKNDLEAVKAARLDKEMSGTISTRRYHILEKHKFFSKRNIFQTARSKKNVIKHKIQECEDLREICIAELLNAKLSDTPDYSSTWQAYRIYRDKAISLHPVLPKEVAYAKFVFAPWLEKHTTASNNPLELKATLEKMERKSEALLVMKRELPEISINLNNVYSLATSYKKAYVKAKCEQIFDPTPENDLAVKKHEEALLLFAHSLNRDLKSLSKYETELSDMVLSVADLEKQCVGMSPSPFTVDTEKRITAAKALYLPEFDLLQNATRALKEISPVLAYESKITSLHLRAQNIVAENLPKVLKEALSGKTPSRVSFDQLEAIIKIDKDIDDFAEIKAKIMQDMVGIQSLHGVQLLLEQDISEGEISMLTPTSTEEERYCANLIDLFCKQKSINALREARGILENEWSNSVDTNSDPTDGPQGPPGDGPQGPPGDEPQGPPVEREVGGLRKRSESLPAPTEISEEQVKMERQGSIAKEIRLKFKDQGISRRRDYRIRVNKEIMQKLHNLLLEESPSSQEIEALFSQLENGLLELKNASAELMKEASNKISKRKSILSKNPATTKDDCLLHAFELENLVLNIHKFESIVTALEEYKAGLYNYWQKKVESPEQEHTEEKTFLEVKRLVCEDLIEDLKKNNKESRLTKAFFAERDNDVSAKARTYYTGQSLSKQLEDVVKAFIDLPEDPSVQEGYIFSCLIRKLQQLASNTDFSATIDKLIENEVQAKEACQRRLLASFQDIVNGLDSNDCNDIIERNAEQNNEDIKSLLVSVEKIKRLHALRESSNGLENMSKESARITEEMQAYELEASSRLQGILGELLALSKEGIPQEKREEYYKDWYKLEHHLLGFAHKPEEEYKLIERLSQLGKILRGFISSSVSVEDRSIAPAGTALLDLLQAWEDGLVDISDVAIGLDTKLEEDYKSIESLVTRRRELFAEITPLVRDLQGNTTAFSRLIDETIDTEVRLLLKLEELVSIEDIIGRNDFEPSNKEEIISKLRTVLSPESESEREIEERRKSLLRTYFEELVNFYETVTSEEEQLAEIIKNIDACMDNPTQDSSMVKHLFFYTDLARTMAETASSKGRPSLPVPSHTVVSQAETVLHTAPSQDLASQTDSGSESESGSESGGDSGSDTVSVVSHTVPSQTVVSQAETVLHTAPAQALASQTDNESGSESGSDTVSVVSHTVPSHTETVVQTVPSQTETEGVSVLQASSDALPSVSPQEELAPPVNEGLVRFRQEIQNSLKKEAEDALTDLKKNVSNKLTLFKNCNSVEEIKNVYGTTKDYIDRDLKRLLGKLDKANLLAGKEDYLASLPKNAKNLGKKLEEFEEKQKAEDEESTVMEEFFLNSVGAWGFTTWTFPQYAEFIEGIEETLPDEVVKATLNLCILLSFLKESLEFSTPASESALTPAPAPVSEPASEPAPVFEPAPASEPVLTPAPAPVSEPAPASEPVLTPTPAPVFEPAPASEPVLTPAPAPVSEPAPASEPVLTPTPAPVFEPAPASEPVFEPAPASEPVLTPTPAPVFEPAPASESALTPAPAPVSEPVLAPASEPALTPAPAPVARFTSTASINMERTHSPTPAPVFEPTPASESASEPAPTPTPTPAPAPKPHFTSTVSIDIRRTHSVRTAPAPSPSPTPSPREFPQLRFMNLLLEEPVFEVCQLASSEGALFETPAQQRSLLLTLIQMRKRAEDWKNKEARFEDFSDCINALPPLDILEKQLQLVSLKALDTEVSNDLMDNLRAVMTTLSQFLSVIPGMSSRAIFTEPAFSFRSIRLDDNTKLKYTKLLKTSEELAKEVKRLLRVERSSLAIAHTDPEKRLEHVVPFKLYAEIQQVIKQTSIYNQAIKDAEEGRIPVTTLSSTIENRLASMERSAVAPYSEYNLTTLIRSEFKSFLDEIDKASSELLELGRPRKSQKERGLDARTTALERYENSIIEAVVPTSDVSPIQVHRYLMQFLAKYAVLKLVAAKVCDPNLTTPFIVSLLKNIVRERNLLDDVLSAKFWKKDES